MQLLKHAPSLVSLLSTTTDSLPWPNDDISNVAPGLPYTPRINRKHRNHSTFKHQIETSLKFIRNYSNRILNPEALLLGKSLGFIPIPCQPERTSMLPAIHQLTRSMRFRCFMHDATNEPYLHHTSCTKEVRNLPRFSPNPPLITYKRAKNIGDNLIRAAFGNSNNCPVSSLLDILTVLLHE